MKPSTILFFLIIYLVTSCNAPSEPKETTKNDISIDKSLPKQEESIKQEVKKTSQNESTDKQDKKKISSVNRASDYFKEETYIAVLKARIKDSPKVFGKSIGVIAYGGICTFLNETTDELQTLELKGEKKTDNWKKVKQIIRDPNNEDGTLEIVGWVFGGYLVKANEIYSETSQDNYERKIIQASANQLSDILGFKVFIAGDYNGTVNYSINEEDEWQKNGKFQVGFSRSLEISGQSKSLRQDYTGNFNSDVPHGLFERKLEGNGNDRHSKIFYNNGECEWAESTEIVAGKTHSYKEKMPKKCDFEYIDKEMYKKEFNTEF